MVYFDQRLITLFAAIRRHLIIASYWMIAPCCGSIIARLQEQLHNASPQ